MGDRRDRMAGQEIGVGNREWKGKTGGMRGTQIQDRFRRDRKRRVERSVGQIREEPRPKIQLKIGHCQKVGKGHGPGNL